jgi:hypothetical protein
MTVSVLKYSHELLTDGVFSRTNTAFHTQISRGKTNMNFAGESVSLRLLE